MSELKIVSDASDPGQPEPSRSALPVPASDAAFTRRDLDMIKRDLITVRKDYSEIRNNMVILTHQHSSAPSKSFFIVFGVVWLLLLAALLVFQPKLSALADRLPEFISRS
jgi:hypothetical protein